MSYGQNSPQGFVETIPLTGATWNTATALYPIKSGYATAIYTGDPVAPLTGGGNNGYIGIGTAGSGIYGVFKGVKYLDGVSNIRQFLPYWPANATTQGSVNAEALIMDDPNVEFNIQVGTSNAGTHTATVNQADLNKNANFVIAAGSTSSGVSGTYLDMATLATTATLSCKLLRLAPVANAGANTIGLPNQDYGVLYNNVIVTFNNHIHKGGTGTAGV